MLTPTQIGRYHLHEQEQQLENNGGGVGEIGDEKYCGIEKVVQVTRFYISLGRKDIEEFKKIIKQRFF